MCSCSLHVGIGGRHGRWHQLSTPSFKTDRGSRTSRKFFLLQLLYGLVYLMLYVLEISSQAELLAVHIDHEDLDSRARQPRTCAQTSLSDTVLLPVDQMK